jgi:hypothetical protein
MRENAAAKARRLLVEGRVTLRSIGETEITAAVRGDSAKVHRVVFDPSGWSCDCDALTRLCSIRGTIALRALSTFGSLAELARHSADGHDSEPDEWRRWRMRLTIELPGAA